MLKTGIRFAQVRAPTPTIGRLIIEDDGYPVRSSDDPRPFALSVAPAKPARSRRVRDVTLAEVRGGPFDYARPCGPRYAQRL